MNDDLFLERFESRTLTHAEWNHRAHVRLAYLYLRRYRFDEAVDRVRAGIQALNAAHGTPESLERGYHETITQAWLQLIHCTLLEYGPGSSAEEFFDEHPQLANKKVLRLFYSRDRLVSLTAKQSFVEPDLAPLPVSGRTNASPAPAAAASG